MEVGPVRFANAEVWDEKTGYTVLAKLDVLKSTSAASDPKAAVLPS